MASIDYKGILVFKDKGGKFQRTQNNIEILTDEYDIKVDTQDKDGKPVALTFEISDAGTLDRETFERKEGVPVLYGKTKYETTYPERLFTFARKLTACFNANKLDGINIGYCANNGYGPDEVSKEDYYNIDYYS